MKPLALINLQYSLRDFFIYHGVERKYWIAFSGGLDSQVLLHLCQSLRSLFPLHLSVIHINHGLSTNAKKWAEHCQNICSLYHLPYVERVIQVEKKVGASLEEEARKKRHAIFAEYLNENDILLTAHHQDDQAETLLLQLMRGAGLKGLAAMPQFKPFAKGFKARPLLHFSRHYLEVYAQEHRLIWIEDESNWNTQLTRNFVRHQILTPLKERFPNITHTIARSTAHVAEAENLLAIYALELYEKVKGSRKETISVSKLMELTGDKQRLVLRYWITQCGFILPNQKKLDAIQENVLQAAWDKNPLVIWKNTCLRRHRDDLFLMILDRDLLLQQSYEWDFKQPLLLEGLGKLHAIEKNGSGLSLDIKQVSIQFRQGGERLSLGGRSRRTLKNLLHEWNVLPWERNRVPLVFADGKFIAAVGYFIEPHYLAKENECGRSIILEKNI